MFTITVGDSFYPGPNLAMPCSFLKQVRVLSILLFIRYVEHDSSHIIPLF